MHARGSSVAVASGVARTVCRMCSHRAFAEVCFVWHGVLLVSKEVAGTSFSRLSAGLDQGLVSIRSDRYSNRGHP